MKIFNLDKSSKELCEYIGFRKCKGFAIAYSYNLPVVKCGVIVDAPLSKEDENTLQKIFGNTSLLCRPDAPPGKWKRLPRGRDCTIKEINSFLFLCRQINTNAILLCFMSPSIYFTGHCVARYKISGGINILIEWYDRVILDYVGPGFDVGELTRGCNDAHQRLIIPWQYVHYPPKLILRHSLEQIISTKKYNEARYQRIETLVQKFNYESSIVHCCIPTEPTKITEIQFIQTWNSCISNIIREAYSFSSINDLLILINLYGDKLHAIEVWDSGT